MKGRNYHTLHFYTMYNYAGIYKYSTVFRYQKYWIYLSKIYNSDMQFNNYAKLLEVMV